MKLFHFNKNKKEDQPVKSKTHSFIDSSEVDETIKFNIDQLKQYFEKRRKNVFDENDSYFVEILEARTEHYNKCGYQDNFVEVLKTNKRMFGYWQSIIPINSLFKDVLLYYYLTVKTHIELPDLKEVIGSSFISDFDAYIRILDSLIERYNNSQKKTNYGACSIEEYTLSVRREVPELTNKEFGLDEDQRRQCNAFYAESVYDSITFFADNLTDNKDRWEIFIGQIAKEKMSKQP